MCAQTKGNSDRALALHNESIVVDMCWTTDLVKPSPIVDGKDALDRAIEGGLTAASQTLAANGTTMRRAIENINDVYRLIDGVPDKVRLVLRASDIELARSEGKLGVIIGWQNASPLEDDAANLLPMFYRQGLRLMQLTYNERALTGCGCLEPRDDGLTGYGGQVVRAANALGIMVDVTHAGQKTAFDIAKATRKPIVASHSNARGLNPSPRNLTDEVIRAVADTGGIVGITTWAVITALSPDQPAMLSDFLQHLDYVVKLVGIDHVGIGTDLNETKRLSPIKTNFEATYGFMLGKLANSRTTFLGDFKWVQEWPNVTRAMLAHGYSEEDVRKVLGLNFMRVAKEVWG